ncbi:MAG: type II secretion system protein [Patescibacteria group bacterium]
MKPMKGFTLIETLVAITVLALAVAGPFQAIQGALRNSFVARDQLVAASLAQEGVEYVRSVRDGNYLGRQSWLTGLAACQPGPCVVDPTQGTVSASIAPLRLSPTGLYTQQVTGGHPLTRFTREVTMTTISTNEVLVTVTVEWQTGGGMFSLSVSENIRDWL